MALVMPGCEGDEHNTGQACRLSLGGSHGPAAVSSARGDVGNIGGAEGIEQVQVILAGQAVDAPHARGAQAAAKAAATVGMRRSEPRAGPRAGAVTSVTRGGSRAHEDVAQGGSVSAHHARPTRVAVTSVTPHGMHRSRQAITSVTPQPAGGGGAYTTVST